MREFQNLLTGLLIIMINNLKKIVGKIKITVPIFLPILLSTIFHFSFASIQRNNEYNSFVLFISVMAVISTILLLGKELQYYKSNNVNELIKKDLFTVLFSSLLISIIVFIFYNRTSAFSFSNFLLLLCPLKVLLDYFVIILNVKNKARFVRYSFDISYALIQIISLTAYHFFFISLNKLIFLLFIYFIIVDIIYFFKIEISLSTINLKLNRFYFQFGKVLISGFGSFVAKFQFIIMSVLAPNLIGLSNIAFTLANAVSVPYNYLSKLKLPTVLADNKKFNNLFIYVRKYSIIFAVPVIFAIVFFIKLNPINLEYFSNKHFNLFLALYLITAIVDILVGLKSSIVQINGNEKILIKNLFLILFLSLCIPVVFNKLLYGIVFYSVFIVYSNLYFYYTFMKCFELDYR
ncbi:hypothetical protein OBA38_00675 [bacterium]|nr:hypothetical protein [bacterium]